MQRLQGENYLRWRDRNWKWFPVVALCFALLGLAALPAHAATFGVSLDNDTLTLGQSTTLSLTFEGASPGNPPEMPNIPGLQIVNNNSRSFSFNAQVGSTSTTSMRVTFTFTVTPERTGEFTIPALTADVDGQQLTSQPVHLRVVQPSAASAAQINSGSQIAFAKLSLPEDKVYEGEIITADLHLYYRQDVQLADRPKLAGMQAEGFTVGKIVPNGQSQVQIGNAIYNVIAAKIALTVNKTGQLQVGPVTVGLVLAVPSNNGFNEPFFQQFRQLGLRVQNFGEEEKPLSVATETVSVKSLQLPTNNVPPDFNGAIGEYSMTVTAGPTNVAVGDPITMHIAISGRGKLDLLTLPKQPEWHGFTVYPPTSKLTTTDTLGLQGTKTFEEIVAPQNTDVHELPPFAFSYFDPDTGTYRTLTESSVALAVRSAGSTPVPTIAATQTGNSQNPPVPKDILPIKDELGALAQAGPPLVTRPAFFVAQSLPVLAFLAAFVWRKRTDSLANNPRLRRQRRVAQLVHDGLMDLRRLAAENSSEEFFAMLFHLLQEQLGERLDSPASSITESVVDEKLVALGAPEPMLNDLRELFQYCNQARYAPIRGSAELNSVVEQFETIIGGLQEVKA